MALLHKCGLAWVTAAATFALWQPCCAAEGQSAASSGTVLSGGNSDLSEGAIALEAGRVEEGIRLTLAGLKETNDPREAAAGHSNVCAGYVLLHEWTQALEHCNLALALDPTNWHTFNNRAAIFSGRGDYPLALADLHSGLELEPKSSTLLKSLSIVEHNQRVLNKRDRTFLRS